MDTWLPKLPYALILLAILAAVGLVYRQTGAVPFVFDDIDQIEQVDHFRPWTLERWLGRRSLPHFTFDLNVWAADLAVPWFHGVNVGLHVVASWLVFWLLREILPSRQRVLFAAIGALVFAVHPLQTQAVTYSVQRITVMAALWYVGSLVTYIRYRKTGRWWWAAASLISAIAAMHSKENSLTLPLTILLLEALFFGSTWRGAVRRRSLALAPWLLLLLIIPANILGVTGSLVARSPADLVTVASWGTLAEGTSQAGAPTRLAYFTTQLSVVREYLRLLIWPAGQNIDHDFPLIVAFTDRRTILSMLLIAGCLAAGGWLWYGRERAAAFGIFFFFVALLPESSFFPLTDLLVEHRLYLPLVGAALVFARLAQKIAFRFPYTAVAGATIILLALGVSSYRRNQVWLDPVTLWSDSVAKSPHKARPHNNLGVALNKVNRSAESIEEYHIAVALDPAYTRAWVNLGSAYGEAGKLAESAEYLQRALALEPRDIVAHYNLGITYQELGEEERAIAAYTAALELNPQFVGPRLNLAVIYTAQRQFERALEHYQELLKQTPDNATVYNNIGTVYFMMGDRARAREALTKALSLDSANAMVRDNLQKLNGKPTSTGLDILQ